MKYRLENFHLEFNLEAVIKSVILVLIDDGGHKLECNATFFFPSLPPTLEKKVDVLWIVTTDDNLMNISRIYIETNQVGNYITKESEDTESNREVNIAHFLTEDCISNIRQAILKQRLDAVKEKAQVSGS